MTTISDKISSLLTGATTVLPLVSVIIPTKNNEKALTKCFYFQSNNKAIQISKSLLSMYFLLIKLTVSPKD
jgi:hypothetical protein